MHPATPQGAVITSSPSTVTAIIPARFNSSRLPGKALIDIGGRPMIEHVYRRAERATRVDSVIVATDDQRISDTVRGFGGQVRLTSSLHKSGTDRVAEIARSLTCELVVNVQGDEPLLNPDSIDIAIATLDSDPELSMSTLRGSITNIEDLNNSNIVKVIVDQNGAAMYFSRSPIPYQLNTTDQTKPPLDSLGHKHIGLYVYRRDFLIRLAKLESTPLERIERLEQLRVLEHGYRIQTARTPDDPIGVDTIEDLEKVRRIVENSPR